MIMTYGALIGTMSSCVATFFLHDQEYSWFASRVWLSRPPLITEEVLNLIMMVPYIVVALIILLLCYVGCIFLNRETAINSDQNKISNTTNKE